MQKKLLNVDQLEDSTVLLDKKAPNTIKIILLTLSAIFIVALLWLVIAKKDVSLEAQASVSSTLPIATIKSEIKGRVLDIVKKDGDEVDSNDNIIKLENKELSSQSENITDSIETLTKKKEQLERLKNSISSGNSVLESTDSDSYKDEFNNYLATVKSLNIDSKVSVNSLLRSAPTTANIDVMKDQEESLRAKLSEIEEQYKSSGDDTFKQGLKIQYNNVSDEIEKINASISLATAEYNSKIADINAGGTDLREQGSAKVEQFKEQTLTTISARIAEIEDQIKIKQGDKKLGDVTNDKLIIKSSVKGKMKLSAGLFAGKDIEINEPLATILPNGAKKKVILYVLPQDIKNLKKDNSITIKFVGDSKILVDAKVTSISEIPTTILPPTKDKDEKTTEAPLTVYEVETEVLTNEQELAYGMIGVANVKTSSEPMWKYVVRKLFE